MWLRHAKFWHFPGIDRSHPWFPVIPILRCSGSQCYNYLAPWDLQRMSTFPKDAAPCFPYDKLGERLTTQAWFNDMSEDLASHFDMEALAASTVGSWTKWWRSQLLSYDFQTRVSVEAVLAVLGIVGVPKGHFIGSAVVKRCQLEEVAGIDGLSLEIIRLFGIIHIFDGSGAMLRHAKAVPGHDDAHDKLRMGLASHGCEDIPLWPTVWATSETLLYMCLLFAYHIVRLQQCDPEASPIALIDDRTEKTFAGTMEVAKLYLPTLFASRTITIHSVQQRAVNFFRGLGGLHLEWRYQDSLSRGSNDFPIAVVALGILFSWMARWAAEPLAAVNLDDEAEDSASEDAEPCDDPTPHSEWRIFKCKTTLELGEQLH